MVTCELDLKSLIICVFLVVNALIGNGMNLNYFNPLKQEMVQPVKAEPFVSADVYVEFNFYN